MLSAIDCVSRLPLAPTAHDARRSVRGYPLLSHELREILAPPAQHFLIDVQSAPLLALGLHDQVNVRVLLIGMQGHDVAVLSAEFFARELPSSGQHLFRWRG